MDTRYLFLAAILAVLPMLWLFFGGKGGGKRCRLPPGPPAVPLLGIIVLLTRAVTDVEPELLLKRLIARYGPIVSLRLGSRVSVFVADRQLTQTALVEAGTALADRPSVPSSRLLGENDHIIGRASYGPVWRLLRRNLVSGMMHPSRVRLFAPARSWVRRVLVDKMRESGGQAPHDVMDTLQYAMFCLFVLMCFGERLDEDTVRAIADAQRDLLIYITSQMAVFAFFPAITKHLFRGRLEKIFALRRRQRELFLPLINARREYKKRGGKQRKETALEHSYVDTLLDIKLPDDGSRAFTDDEIIKLCSEFLNGGTDTTATTLQWIMAEVVKNPAIQRKLYDEIKAKTSDDQPEVSQDDVDDIPYLRAVVLEGLRKHPPGHFVLPHRAAEDIEVGGYLIPKDATVNFMVAETSRDEREWKNPMEFIPERFLRGGDGEEVDVTGTKGIRMMPFGVGRRICAGITMAMLHLEYFLANMVREFEWKDLAGDEVDFAEKREFTTVMVKPLRARFMPRKA